MIIGACGRPLRTSDLPRVEPPSIIRETESSDPSRSARDSVFRGVSPGALFYRDVTPRRYAVTVDSYLDNYVYQFTSIDLAAGQEAYIKVLSMRRDKASGEA